MNEPTSPSLTGKSVIMNEPPDPRKQPRAHQLLGCAGVRLLPRAGGRACRAILWVHRGAQLQTSPFQTLSAELRDPTSCRVQTRTVKGGVGASRTRRSVLEGRGSGTGVASVPTGAKFHG